MTISTYPLRRAHHAGSWYDESKVGLEQVLTKNLAAVVVPPSDNTADGSRGMVGVVRGLVGPHAGYAYSGPTAAYAYQHLTASLIRNSHPNQDGGVVVVDTILVLHPSHHVYLDGCALSGAEHIETPLGNLSVAWELRKELWTTKQFTLMNQDTDEREHSGELHYPYIAKSLQDAGLFEQIRVLPIMVGGISHSKEEHFGTVLKEIIARPNVITIVSTDFCHWGKRFRYQPIPSEGIAKKPIFQHISDLDHEGMKHIEMQEPGAFAKYFQQTKNTVCGRHPLAVWLHAISQNKESNVETLDVKFVRYAQSSEVRSMNDSSVSYASAIAMQLNN
jgi:MEMO1 family protein